MQFEVTLCIKHIEEDAFAMGCMPETSQSWPIDIKIKANSLSELLQYIKNFTGVDDDNAIEIDACDEPGRIDVQLLEDFHGMPASPALIETWKQGHHRLILADYSFYVEAVERRTVELSALQAA